MVELTVFHYEVTTHDMRARLNIYADGVVATVEWKGLKDTAWSPAIVLTLDVSLSMEYEDRIKKLHTALRTWIPRIPNGLLLGFVEFNTFAKILSNLTVVDAQSQKQLMQRIPTSVQGETCLGCGVQLALQVLGKRKGIMVLVTDGQNTEPGQFISNVQADVVESGTKVVAVGFGENAPLDDLKQLAIATRGQFFYVSDQDGVQGLLYALKGALELAHLQLGKSTGMTQTWNTEDSERSTDQPVPSTTVRMKEFTTALGNKTTSHLIPVMQQHSTRLEKLTGMTQTWNTEDSERSTYQPVPSITVSMKDSTTALGNKTTSHLIPVMQQHSTPLSLSEIVGIIAVVVVGVVLAFIGLRTWRKCAVKRIRGFYSVVKQNNIRLHNQA